MAKQPLRAEARILINENPVSVEALTGEERRALACWIQRTWLEARFGNAVRWEESDGSDQDRREFSS